MPINMSITMFTTCSFHMYNFPLVHTFYNTTVAKNVTVQTLEHIINTATPQPRISSATAVKDNREAVPPPTLCTAPTTTIFNKVVTRTKSLPNKSLTQTYTIKN